MGCLAPSIVSLLRQCGQKVDRYVLQLAKEQGEKEKRGEEGSDDSLSGFEAGPAPEGEDDYFPDSDENEGTLSDKKRVFE